MSEVKYQYFCTKCGTERDGLLDHPARGIGGYSWNCPRCNGPVDSREVVMSEAPKKIWVDKDELGWPEADEFHQRMQTRESKEYGIPYIREDVVLELVEALERLIAFHDDLDYGYSRTIELDKAALAKFKKLEESHD